MYPLTLPVSTNARLFNFVFIGKRIPSAKTRPLRQGSKKPLLEENLEALGVSEPVPDDSKSRWAGLSQGQAAPLSDVVSLLLYLDIRIESDLKGIFQAPNSFETIGLEKSKQPTQP